MSNFEKMFLQAQLDFAVLNAFIESTSAMGMTNFNRIYEHLKPLRKHWLMLPSSASPYSSIVISETVSRLVAHFECASIAPKENGLYELNDDRAQELLLVFAEQLDESMEFEYGEQFNLADLKNNDFSNIRYNDFPDECILTPHDLSKLAAIAYEDHLLFK